MARKSLSRLMARSTTSASLHDRPSKLAPMKVAGYRRLARARLAYQLDRLALKLF
jgi:hypothetical protein